MAAFTATNTGFASSTTISTGDVVWSHWNCTSCTTTATTWGTWNENYAIATTSTASAVNLAWRVWNTQAEAIGARLNSDAITRIQGSIAAPYVPRKKTEAEVQAELKRQQELEKQLAERKAAELAAKQKAEKLLLENLSPEQRDTLVKRGFFYLHLQNGKKYRLDRHTHGNVYLVDEKNSVIRKFCAQPHGVPADDAILAQKLALETDEQAFIRVANATEIRRMA